MSNIEDVIQYFDICGSYTYNTLQSEENLKNFRKDILKLFNCDTNNIMDFSKYFENIEVFEIQLIYVLYFEFYPGQKNKTIILKKYLYKTKRVGLPPALFIYNKKQ